MTSLGTTGVVTLNLIGASKPGSEDLQALHKLHIIKNPYIIKNQFTTRRPCTTRNQYITKSSAMSECRDTLLLERGVTQTLCERCIPDDRRCLRVWDILLRLHLSTRYHRLHVTTRDPHCRSMYHLPLAHRCVQHTPFIQVIKCARTIVRWKSSFAAPLNAGTATVTTAETAVVFECVPVLEVATLNDVTGAAVDEDSCLLIGH